MRKIVLLLFSLALLINSNIIVTASENSITNPKVSSAEDPKNDPIKIDLKLKDKKKDKNKWDIDIDTYVMFDRKSDKDVTVTTQVYKLSEDKYYLVPLTSKKEVFTKKLEHKKPEKFLEKLNKLENGQYKIVIQASSKQNEGLTYGGYKELLITVTNNDVKQGWEEKVPHLIPAALSNGTNSRLISSPFSKDYGYDEKDLKKHGVTDPAGKKTIEIGTAAVQTNSTLTGRWASYYRDNSILPIKYAQVEVRYRDQYYIWRTATTTYTDANGNYTATYERPSNSNLWEVRLTLQNNYANVEDQSANTWGSVYQSTDLSNGGSIPGDTLLPRWSENEVASWVYNDIIRTYNTLSNYRSPGGKATVVWYTGAAPDGGAHWTSSTNKTYLADRSAYNNTTTIHELGHNYMYYLYGNWYPPTDCTTGSHTNSGTTETGCAWTEGWAHFLALAMNNNSIYTYSNGSTWNAENTSGYDTNGDRVEGRVAGALWDLYDTINDGLDIRSYTFADIYRTMNLGRLNNFAAFWNEWKYLGYDSDAKYSLHQNGIMYDYTSTPNYTVLSSGTPQYVNGESVKVFQINGFGGYPTIQTSYYVQSSDTYIELYTDANLTNRVAYDDDSAGNYYSKINSYYLNFGQTYFLKVRHYNDGNPVYAQISYSTTGGSASSYPVLSPSSPGYVNGETQKVFQINGYGGYPTIQTSLYNQSSDTYLELYTDPSLTSRVAYDDDSAGNQYSRINNYYLNAGQMYYLKVRNYSSGSPVYAQVTMSTSTSSGYPALSVGSTSYVNGETQKIYQITGNGGYPTIETSYYSQSTDTYLELYSDAGLSNRVAYDDDSAGSLYSRITNYYFNYGQIYYLKVRNYNSGNPTYCQVRMY